MRSESGPRRARPTAPRKFSAAAVRSLIVLALVTTPGRVASAQTSPAVESETDEQRVQRLKDLGEDALINLRHEEALAYYDEAYRLIADPALLYNRSRALQGLSRFPEALAQLEQFVREASPELKARVPKLDALVEELRNKVARVTVRSNVRGASVLLNGKLIGKTPLSALPVNAGKGELQVSKEGYRPASKKLDLRGNAVTTVALDLERRDVRAKLVLSSSATNAVVKIDGKRVGTTPTQVFLAPGKHAIKVEHESYETWESSVELGQNENRRLRIELEPHPAIYEKWWFWTTVGVTVAGGVALGIALTTERDPDSGDIPPGNVVVPLLGGASARF